MERDGADAFGKRVMACGRIGQGEHFASFIEKVAGNAAPRIAKGTGDRDKVFHE
jgi:hypothetical protein